MCGGGWCRVLCGGNVFIYDAGNAMEVLDLLAQFVPMRLRLCVLFGGEHIYKKNWGFSICFTLYLSNGFFLEHKIHD